MLFERVNPGDLIKANLFNRMMTAIENLQEEVDALRREVPKEGEGPVIIEVTPSTDVRLNQRITVIGRNFADEVDQNDVSIGGVPITRFFPGSDNTTLIFSVPPAIPRTPGTVPLVVRVDTKSDSMNLNVSAAAPPEMRGRPNVLDTTPDLGRINVGDPYTFVFVIDPQITVAERYTVSANYTNVVGSTAAEWKRETTLLTATGGSLPSTITLDPDKPFTVKVRVRVPGGTSADLSLNLKSENFHPAASASSPPIKIKVGEEQPDSDNRTTLAIVRPGPASSVKLVSIDGVDGFEFPFGGTGTASVNLKFTVAGKYNYKAEIEPDSGEWELLAVSPATTEEEVDSQEKVGIRLKLTADPSADLQERTVLFTASHDDINELVSFIRFPIRGYERQ